MRYEVDSYTLEYVEDEDKYYISFRDSVEQDCRIEIDKDIFDTYTNSKKAYIKKYNIISEAQKVPAPDFSYPQGFHTAWPAPLDFLHFPHVP